MGSGAILHDQLAGGVFRGDARGVVLRAGERLGLDADGGIKNEG